MATNSTNKIKGLWTFPNYLSANPDGSQEIADNVVIDADDTLEPRRGQKIIATLPEQAKQLMQYNSQVMPHFGDAVGYLDNSDPANLTTFQVKDSFKVVTVGQVYKLDHGLAAGTPIYFEQLQDFSALPTETFFPLPTGLDNYNEFYVFTVIDKDNFTVALSPIGPAIALGIGTATVVHNAIINEIEVGLRTKFVETNGNCYFTSANGIKKVSSLTQNGLSNAGGIQALNLELDLNLTTSGFFSPITDPSFLDVEVSYRMVWGTKDINGNLILGAPSAIATVANYTKRGCAVDVTFTVPRGINLNYFYQIYRTRVSPIGESGDEQKLVIESPYDGYSTAITITDNTSDDIRDSGLPLYSNETSGEGAFQINTPPPVSKDIAVYKNRVFYANTKTDQKLDLTFLGFDGIQAGLAVTNVTGSMVSASFDVLHAGTILVGHYIALANTNGVDGQYLVTAVLGDNITIAADSTLIGLNAVLYRSHITFTKGTRIDRYFFVGRPETWTITAQPAANVNSPMPDVDYFFLTSIDDKLKYYFYFKKNPGDLDPNLSGKVGIEVDLVTAPVPTTDEEVAVRIREAIESVGDFVVSTDTVNPEILYVSTSTSGKVTDIDSGTQIGGSVSITTTQDGFGEDADAQFIRLSTFASPAQAIEDTAKSLVRVVNQDSTNPVYAVYLSTATSLPGRINFEERSYSEEPFSVVANNMTVGALFNPNITTNTFSSQTISSNAISFSKVQQPEAVPLVNRFEVGARNKPILRIIGLRDSLFILKQDGIYVLTGENEQNFSIRLFDTDAALTAPDSAVTLNNQIYCATTQGLVTISDNGGLQIISRNIENIISRIGSEDYTGFYYGSFGVAYEVDRSYLFYTIDLSSDAQATVCYRYNTFTQTFTRFTTPAQAGLIQAGKNKLFIANTDGPTIETERKKLNSRDYADREYSRQISDVQFKKIFLDDTQLIEAGDVLTQKQYLKTTDYNRIVQQLKLDPNLQFPQAFPEMPSDGSAEISATMLELASTLNFVDQSLLSVQFDAMIDVNSMTNTITSTAHGLLDEDIVLISGAILPSPLVEGIYEITSATINTFKLRPLGLQAISGIAAGFGQFTIGAKTLVFNMVREIDYDSSTILFPNSTLSNGDILTFTTSETPPTGLVSGTQYEAINVSPSGFQLRLVEIDLTAAAVSGIVQVDEIYYASGTQDNKEAQVEFNNIVNKLNNSDPTDAQLLLNPNLTYVFLSNYPLSVGFEEIDYIVNFVSISQNYVTTDNLSNMQINQITHYKGIKAKTVWNYFTLGEPAILKHVRSGSVIIKQNNLNTFTVGYASDLSGNFEDVEFKLDRSGIFGGSFFGQSTWGGEGVAYPLRTLIPKQKQRCRYIKPRILHGTAFRKFNVLGISFDFEMTSEKTSRK